MSNPADNRASPTASWADIQCFWDGVEIQLLGFCLQERLVLGLFLGLLGGFFAGTFGQHLLADLDMLIDYLI